MGASGSIARPASDLGDPIEEVASMLAFGILFGDAKFSVMLNLPFRTCIGTGGAVEGELPKGASLASPIGAGDS